MARIELTEDQKLQLGIEIVAAMKANAYGVSLEVGRDFALEHTEPDERADLLSPENKEMHLHAVSRNKKILHDQALFVANAALSKLERLT